MKKGVGCLLGQIVIVGVTVLEMVSTVAIANPGERVAKGHQDAIQAAASEHIIAFTRVGIEDGCRTQPTRMLLSRTLLLTLWSNQLSEGQRQRCG